MGEKMDSEREAFEKWADDNNMNTSILYGEYVNDTTDSAWSAWQARAHITQPAQAVDVGAEDRFEQYVKTLIDKAPDVQKLGERLALWLNDDQFNNIEPTLLGIARALTAALPKDSNGAEGV